MAKVEIYTSPFCGYCVQAKSLLEKKGATFKEISTLSTAGARDEMIARANGHHTVPQFFINGEHIGGCDELYALDRAGGLDPKLAREPS